MSNCINHSFLSLLCCLFAVIFYKQVYRRIDPVDNSVWWTDFCTVVRHEIRKLSNDINSANARESVHNSVQSDVTRLFKVSIVLLAQKKTILQEVFMNYHSFWRAFGDGTIIYGIF